MWHLSIKKEDNQLPELLPNLTFANFFRTYHIFSIDGTLRNNKSLYEFQHGFRSSKSCDIKLIYDLTRNYEKQTDVILMDIAKPFDTVPHNRLRLKL